jgi:hypothetical protein
MLPRKPLPCLCLASLLILAGPISRASPAAVAPADAFALLKSLAGEWSGRVVDRATGPAATVVYRVTAGGSVVEERLFPGTDHEMVTMYHLDGAKLVLTHYCAMGNQPRMVLAPDSTRERLVFTFESAGNLASPDATHMRSGWIRFVDADTLEAGWEVFGQGAKIGENLFFLSRRTGG